jgi:hypothetical protein
MYIEPTQTTSLTNIAINQRKTTSGLATTRITLVLRPSNVMIDAPGYAPVPGSSKGRSFIVNHLTMNPGSTITYGQKGGLPSILASRCGDGYLLCDSMGQQAFALGPLSR